MSFDKAWQASGLDPHGKTPNTLIFAKELSIFEIILEGDAEVITKALLAEDVSHPEVGLVLNDVLVLAAEFRFL